MNNYEIYYLLTLIAFVLTFGAQAYIRYTYSKYSKVHSSLSITGANAATRILRSNDLERIILNQSHGYLSDHYDPKNKMVVLSEYNYSDTSISAIAVSAHECGHALQDKDSYNFLKIRSSLFPVVSFSSYAGYIAISMGVMFSMINLIWIGIIMEMVILLFQFITLPVEFDASSRALKQIEQLELLNNDELKDAKKVLIAAALTYVAGVASTLIQILRLIMMVNPRSSRKR